MEHLYTFSLGLSVVVFVCAELHMLICYLDVRDGRDRSPWGQTLWLGWIVQTVMIVIAMIYLIGLLVRWFL